MSRKSKFSVIFAGCSIMGFLGSSAVQNLATILGNIPSLSAFLPYILFLFPVIGVLLLFWKLIRTKMYYREISCFFNQLKPRAEMFFRDPVSAISERFARKQFAALGIALVAFLVHFWIQWVYGRQFILSGIMLLIVDPFNFLVQAGIPQALSFRYFAVNSFTGNPFFLLPIVYSLGYSPDAFRLVLASVNAATYMVLFLAYYEAFDLKKAAVGILILSGMSKWVRYSWPDYDIMLLCFSVLLLLYFKWESAGGKPGSRYLYMIAFLGGISFYFKATILYVLAGLFAAGLCLRRDEVVEFTRDLDITGLCSLFLIGSAPSFIYASIHSNVLREDGFSFGGPQNPSIGEIAIERLFQLDHWLYYGKTDFFSVLSGFRYLDFMSAVSEIHLLTILLLLSVLVLVLSQEKLRLIVLITSLYIMLFFLPLGSRISIHDMIVVVPLVPLIILAASEVLLGFLSGKKYDILIGAVTVVLAIFFLNNLHTMQPHEGVEKVDLSDWGGEQEFYNDLSQIQTSDQVLTNSYKVYVTSRYLLDITTSKFVASSRLSSLPEEAIANSTKEGGRPNIVDFYNSSVMGQHTMPLNRSRNVTLVLLEDLPCSPETDFCGMRTNRVVEKFDLDRTELEEARLGNSSYLIAENVSLDR